MCFISMYNALNTLSEYIYFYISKTLLHTLSCLFLKLSKAFIVSLYPLGLSIKFWFHLDATWDYHVNSCFTRTLLNMRNLFSENLTDAKGLVPESNKLQFTLKPWFQRLIRILFSKHNSFSRNFYCNCSSELL